LEQVLLDLAGKDVQTTECRSILQAFFIRARLLSAVSAIATVGFSGQIEATGTQTVWLGATLSGGLDDPSNIPAFQAMTGHRVNIVSIPMPWAADGGFIHFASSIQPWAQAVASYGALPMVTWEPEMWTDEVAPLVGACPSEIATESSTSSIIQYIQKFASEVAAYGKPILLRPMHEMNISGWVWSVGFNPWCGYVTADDFIKAWRRIVTIFREEGATNAYFIWCVNWASIGTLPGSVMQTYPGDAYVHFAAIDGYNFGGNAWHSFDQIFQAPYSAIVAGSKRKILIAEWASAEAGGNKAAWISAAFASIKANHYPQIQGLVWFDEDVSGDPPWPINSSASAAAAYKASAKNLP
jgi:beta-mannanase